MTLSRSVQASAFRAALLCDLGAADVTNQIASVLTGAAELDDVRAAITSSKAPWDGSGTSPLRGPAIPVASQLLFAAESAHGALKATDAGGGIDFGLASDIVASMADDELSREVAAATASVLRDVRAQEALRSPAAAARSLATSLSHVSMPDAELLRRVVGCAELRHPYSRRHGASTASVALTLARSLRLDPPTLHRIELAALAHDIGELAVAVETLASSSRFATVPAVLREHADRSAQACRAVPFLAPVANIVLTHHEHVDGSGYPTGLRGSSIPIEARIVAVADAVDALRSERAFRDALSADEVATRLRAGRGTVFDSDVVDAASKSLDFR